MQQTRDPLPVEEPRVTDREENLRRLAQNGVWDLAVVGGGATGAGLAFEAARRGLQVVLLEAGDFGHGTSSRSTKLVHGGVRYLAQGRVGLVYEALHERARFLQMAPHLAQPLPFVIPSYRCWQTPFHGIGLKLYDLLAGSAGLGGTQWLSAAQARQSLPTLQPQGLTGAVRYVDGQFDDARFLIALVRTAALHGALAVNYCAVTGLTRTHGKIDGLSCRDGESGREYRLRARCVVNATGVWADRVRRQFSDMEAEKGGRVGSHSTGPTIAPSQGVHIVVDRDFLPGDQALVVPHTSDGRILFAVPWLGKIVIGTTDTPRSDVPLEPEPLPGELTFLLSESARYLVRAPRVEDIRSIWAGLRPLVRPPGSDRLQSSRISREHTVWLDADGLVTVTGGKWTIWHAMAEDVIEHCIGAGLLPRSADRVAGRTAGRAAERVGHQTEAGDSGPPRLVGAPAGGVPGVPLHAAPGPHLYGSEATVLDGLPGAQRELGGHLSEAMVRFAVRHEYARTVEDVLARRSRLLFTDAGLAAELAEEVGAILREETGMEPGLEEFVRLARTYGRGRAEGMLSPGR